MTPQHEMPGLKAGFWSTVTAAIIGGWGTTVRLLIVFTLLALLVSGVLIATDGNVIGIRPVAGAPRPPTSHALADCLEGRPR